MYSPEQSARILLLRAKVQANTITQEELREGLALLRQQRTAAHAVSATSRARTAKAKTPVDSNSLLGELDNL